MDDVLKKDLFRDAETISPLRQFLRLGCIRFSLFMRDNLEVNSILGFVF